MHVCVCVCVCENMPNCSYVNNAGKCLSVRVFMCVCAITLSVCQLRDPSLVTWQKGISSSSAQLVLIVRECVRVFCGSSQVPAVSCCSCCCCHCSCSCCYSWRCLLLVERTISLSVCTAAAVAAGGAVGEREGWRRWGKVLAV